MLVRRLAHALKKANPDSDLPAKALDYLKAAGVVHSVFREPEIANAYARFENALAPTADQAVDPVREALRKLVEQIDVVIASPEYESVFAMGMIRGQPYRGPQFADQLEAARRALESTPSREKP